MRFSLFVHMERWDESVSHRELFENLAELTLLAETGGFGTVWIGEHHSMEYTISPSPMPLLAYLAGKTTTIRLGAGTIIAPFWHPIRPRVNARCSTSSATGGLRSVWPVAHTNSNSIA